jgi:ABC-type sugar transport system ATPase subunit
MADSINPVVFQARGIKKIYPGTIALRDVNFTVYGGAVNALVGENGAGKSTLMKIIAGIEQPNGGTMRLVGEDGVTEEVSFTNTREAAAKGIGIVHQELNLFADLSVAENLFMNKELKKYHSLYIDHDEQEKLAVKVLKKLGQDIDPKTPVRDLRLGQQQIVEIAKTMIDEPKILIMDEPTSSLSVPEVKVLFRVMEDLKSHGVAIIYISHRLEEIKEMGDYITILRDARLIDSGKVAEMEMPDIIEKMVGRDPKKFFSGQAHEMGDVLLEVKDMTLPRYGGGYTLDRVSFTVRKGEVLGIYGLMGAGRTELLESLAGNMDKAEGGIKLDGVRIDGMDTKERIAAGLVLIPEERQREGLFLNLEVNKNLTMASIGKYARRGLHIQNAEEKVGVAKMIESMGIKVASPEINISALSGGNQQKVVIGRALLTNPKILMMDEPTRGIDVGAKSDVFKIVDSMAKEGFGILLVSSELEEVVSMSDRILVLCKGQVAGGFDRSEVNEETIRKASEQGTCVDID